MNVSLSNRRRFSGTFVLPPVANLRAASLPRRTRRFPTSLLGPTGLQFAIREGVGERMFDEHGNLSAGFTDWTIPQVQERLVDAFPSSHSRPAIIAGYARLRAEM